MRAPTSIQATEQKPLRGMLFLKAKVKKGKRSPKQGRG